MDEILVILVKTQLTQRVLVCDHAGLVINKLSTPEGKNKAAALWSQCAFKQERVQRKKIPPWSGVPWHGPASSLTAWPCCLWPVGVPTNMILRQFGI